MLLPTKHLYMVPFSCLRTHDEDTSITVLVHSVPKPAPHRLPCCPSLNARYFRGFICLLPLSYLSPATTRQLPLLVTSRVCLPSAPHCHYLWASSHCFTLGVLPQVLNWPPCLYEPLLEGSLEEKASGCVPLAESLPDSSSPVHGVKCDLISLSMALDQFLDNFLT